MKLRMLLWYNGGGDLVYDGPQHITSGRYRLECCDGDVAFKGYSRHRWFGGSS